MDTIAFSDASAKSSKVTALAVAQSQVAGEQRTIELLTSIFAEMKINADNKNSCYFETRAHALERSIDREATTLDLDTALNDANGDLPTLEYKYRTAGAAANRAETATANVTNKLQKLTSLLANITPKETPEIEVAITRIVTPLCEVPTATAEMIRKRVAH